jgi:hypothetical protein
LSSISGASIFASDGGIFGNLTKTLRRTDGSNQRHNEQPLEKAKENQQRSHDDRIYKTSARNGQSAKRKYPSMESHERQRNDNNRSFSSSRTGCTREDTATSTSDTSSNKNKSIIKLCEGDEDTDSGQEQQISGTSKRNTPVAGRSDGTEYEDSCVRNEKRKPKYAEEACATPNSKRPSSDFNQNEHEVIDLSRDDSEISQSRRKKRDQSSHTATGQSSNGFAIPLLKSIYGGKKKSRNVSNANRKRRNETADDTANASSDEDRKPPPAKQGKKEATQSVLKHTFSTFEKALGMADSSARRFSPNFASNIPDARHSSAPTSSSSPPPRKSRNQATYADRQGSFRLEKVNGPVKRELNLIYFQKICFCVYRDQELSFTFSHG